MNGTKSDPKAAAVHRARADKDYRAAERFRKLGLERSAADALRFARQEDSIAEILEGRSTR